LERRGERARGPGRRFLRALGLGALASWVAIASLLPVSCIFEAWGEDEDCRRHGEPLASGESSHGIDPAEKTASLIRAHTGTLEWTLANRTTPITFDIRQNDSFYEKYCDDAFIGFSTVAEADISSEDGLIDHSETWSVELSRIGALATDNILRVYPSFEELKAAGVTNPNMISGYSVELAIHIDPKTLEPRDAIVTIPEARPEPLTIGIITFDD
jgi:hypothetical protein